MHTSSQPVPPPPNSCSGLVLMVLETSPTPLIPQTGPHLLVHSQWLQLAEQPHFQLVNVLDLHHQHWELICVTNINLINAHQRHHCLQYIQGYHFGSLITAYLLVYSVSKRAESTAGYNPQPAANKGSEKHPCASSVCLWNPESDRKFKGRCTWEAWPESASKSARSQ